MRHAINVFLLISVIAMMILAWDGRHLDPMWNKVLTGLSTILCAYLFIKGVSNCGSAIPKTQNTVFKKKDNN